MTFRDEMFKLCQKMENEHITLKIRNQLDGMNVGSKSMLFQSGTHDSSHFLGMLLLNEKIESNKNDPILNTISKMNIDEKKTISIAHSILIYFLNECLSSISSIPLTLKLALNPYLKFISLEKPIEIDVTKHIDTTIFTEAADSFSNTKIAKLFENELKKHQTQLHKMSAVDINMLLAVIESEITKVGFDQVPPTLADLSRSRFSDKTSMENDLLSFFYLCYCLQSTLIVSLEMLFTVLKNEKMGVIDEECIININKSFSNSLKKGKEFLLQETNKPSPQIAQLCVLDYSIKAYDINVHEFGYCVATTLSFSGEYGDTLKCKLNIIDEDLNQYEIIHSLYGEI